MTEQTQADDAAVLEQVDAADHITPDDVPEPIMAVLRYIVENTGLTGDYNDGIIQLTDTGRTIQWYPRSRLFSSHDGLLTWVQTEADDVILGQVGSRPHPNKDDETSGYIEIHETSRWVPEE